MTKDPIFALAEHVAGATIEEMPDSAIAAAKTFILDTLGVAFSGTSGPMAGDLLDAMTSMGGGEDAGVDRDDDIVDVQTVGERGGVQSTRTAEGEQRMVFGVVAAFDGDGTDCFGHGFVGDRQPVEEQRLGVGAFAGVRFDAVAPRIECGLRRRGIERDADAGRVEDQVLDVVLFLEDRTDPLGL